MLSCLYLQQRKLKMLRKRLYKQGKLVEAYTIDFEIKLVRSRIKKLQEKEC
jgi:hypothetical protein